MGKFDLFFGEDISVEMKRLSDKMIARFSIGR